MNIDDEFVEEMKDHWPNTNRGYLAEWTTDFITKQQPLPIEYQKVVDDNFWDLIDE